MRWSSSVRTFSSVCARELDLATQTERVGPVGVAQNEPRLAFVRGDVERGAAQVLDGGGRHHDRQLALLNHDVVVARVGERIEAQVVGVLDALLTGYLDAQSERLRLFLLGPQLQDPLDGDVGDRQDVGRHVGLAHAQRLSAGAQYGCSVLRPFHPLNQLLQVIFRNGKRIAVFVLGNLLLVAGVVMLVVPGPGLLVIIAGLAVLATEFTWAEHLLDTAKEKASQAKDKVTSRRWPWQTRSVERRPAVIHAPRPGP